MQIVLGVILLAVSYLEYLGKCSDQPRVSLVIRRCQNDTSSWLGRYANLFLSKAPVECDLYRLDLSFLLLLIKCLCLAQSLRLLTHLFQQLGYVILRCQVKPFVHLRSVALTNAEQRKSSA